MNTKKGDLSTHKHSHISASLTDQVEFHLNNREQNPKGIKVGSKYVMTFPVVCTSKDVDDTRYRTTGLPKVDPDKRPVPAVPGLASKSKFSTQVYK